MLLTITKEEKNMKISLHSTFVLSALILSACTLGQSAPPAASTLLPTEAAGNAPVVSGGYQPVSAEVCQILQEDAHQSLGLTFTLEASAPFTANGEIGFGCSLTANTTGAVLSDPNDALVKLVNGFVGWNEDMSYVAGGPTGAATGMTRDSGLILIAVGWEPAPEANCPKDQPISTCILTPDQQLYTVTIQAAQK